MKTTLIAAALALSITASADAAIITNNSNSTIYLKVLPGTSGCDSKHKANLHDRIALEYHKLTQSKEVTAVKEEIALNAKALKKAVGEKKKKSLLKKGLSLAKKAAKATKKAATILANKALDAAQKCEKKMGPFTLKAGKPITLITGSMVIASRGGLYSVLKKPFKVRASKSISLEKGPIGNLGGIKVVYK